jgi:hypothetical protein
MKASLNVQYDNDSVSHITCGDIDLLPYVNKAGEYNMPDSFLAQAYRRTVIEKSIHKVFYDESIHSTNEFIDYFKKDGIELFFVYYKEEETGFFWLSPFVKKSAFITYCIYKNFLRESLTISQACIQGIFAMKDAHGETRLDTLLGLTPASNKFALKFLIKIGMTVVGKIPGLICDSGKERGDDAIISYLSRPGKNKMGILSTFLGIAPNKFLGSGLEI